MEFWKKYTETALEQNVNPVWLNRIGQVDWLEITEWVEQDINKKKELSSLNNVMKSE